MFVFGEKITAERPLEVIAPAAMATEPDSRRSNRYAFVSTTEVIKEMAKYGWYPAFARQTGKGIYGRHVIRFSDDSGTLPKQVDDVFPQIIFDNSHNGTSRATFHIGLFRLVCSNGLVVREKDTDFSISVKHISVTAEAVMEVLKKMTERFNEVSKTIRKFQKIELTPEQQTEFAIKAIAAREPMVFVREDGTIDREKAEKVYSVQEILTPRREEDTKPTLWNVFNTTQERLVNGYMERKTVKGRRSKAREIKNIGRNLEFNANLWELAQQFAN